MMDLYEILGVARDATTDEIEKAYRRRARETHPDRGGDIEDFKRADLARRTLTDEEARERYDATGRDVDQGDAVNAPGPDELIALKAIGDLIFEDSPRDILKVARENIQTTLSQLRRRIKKAEQLHAKLKKKAGRLPEQNRNTTNTAGLEFLQNAFAEQLELSAGDIEQLKQRAGHYESAIGILEDLRLYDPDATPLGPGIGNRGRSWTFYLGPDKTPGT